MTQLRPSSRVRWEANAAGASVVVTGGAGGIGAACARAFGRAGASVVILDIADGSAVAESVTKVGPGHCAFIRCDVGDWTALAETVADVVSTLGGIDCLINNAARFLFPRQIDDVSYDDVERLWRVNVGSYFAAAKAALPSLRVSRGSIVNVSSIVGEIGQHHNAVYCATKGAVTALTRALAIDEAGSGVRVNAVAPGEVATPTSLQEIAKAARPHEVQSLRDSLQWIGRVSTPDEIARVCLFLTSDAASFITGAVVNVTGGLEIGHGPKHPYPTLDAQPADSIGEL